MSMVGAVSRFSNSLACCKVGQSPMMPPRFKAPPSTRAVEAVPWSVPLVPLMRAVRPNSVATITTVLLHSGPRPLERPSITASRPRRRLASWPSAAPWLACVSNPSRETAAICGPLGSVMNLARVTPILRAASIACWPAWAA